MTLSMMPLWKRLALTFVVLLIASLVAGLIWQVLFDAVIPSYLSGVVGGVAALAGWEILRPRT